MSFEAAQVGVDLVLERTELRKDHLLQNGTWGTEYEFLQEGLIHWKREVARMQRVIAVIEDSLQFAEGRPE